MGSEMCIRDRYIVIGHRVTKSEMCEKCSVSIPTLNKIEAIIKKHLEAKS